MATHLSDSAYDLSLFEAKEPKLIALKPNKKEVKSQHRRQKLQTILNVSAYVLIAAVVLAVIGFLITTNVQLTELNSQIAETKTRLSELQSERVRLESELAANTSIAQVNKYATERGMVLADSHQVTYITVAGADTVTVAAEDTHFLNRLFHTVKGFFS